MTDILFPFLPAFSSAMADMTAPSNDRHIVATASQLEFGFAGAPALFSGLNLAIPAGVTLVRGGDGRGKTSLLRLLAGVMPATSGVLSLNGVRLDEDNAAYRRQVFYVDPRTETYDQLSPPEFFEAMAERFPGFDRARLPALCEGLSLAPHLEKKLFMLSTGSKRKVYLAAAFAAGAALNLLDDPFAGLDMGSIRFVSATLDQYHANSAADHGHQAWVLAMYEVPAGILLDSHIDLGD